jgi:hypothetical protein
LQVKAGQLLTFTGQVTANTPGFLAQVALPGDEDRADLQRDGYHLEVDSRTVHVAG